VHRRAAREFPAVDLAVSRYITRLIRRFYARPVKDSRDRIRNEETNRARNICALSADLSLSGVD
jgi:hypothetical protein